MTRGLCFSRWATKNAPNVAAIRVGGLDVSERAIRPVAGVGLHQPRLLDGLEADARGDDVGRLPRARQRAAPQRRELVAGRLLRQRTGLLAPAIGEGHRALALEAPLGVVGGLPVTGQPDQAE